ncbi:MAG: hypothetical protein ABSF14_20420 [Terriglobia bacterium]
MLLHAREVIAAQAERDRPDEIAFIDALRIEDKVSGGLIPFALWPFQIEFVARLASLDRVFALKARQLGITWTVLAHMLYQGTFWGNRLFLVASQSGADAVDALHRLRILHGSIPEEWRPAKLVDNTEQIAFANGSRYEAGKATKRYGRGKAAYSSLADEFAFWEWPEDMLTSLDSASQRLYAVTTGNGPGDHAHRIWSDSEQGKGRWTTIFYPWSSHPGRDADWYRLNVTESPEPRLANREHASSPRDAFAAPAGVYFERWSDRNETEQGATPSWSTCRAVDFGRRHPACLWVQTSPAGQPIVVAEFAPAARAASAAMTTQELVEHIQSIDRGLGLLTAPTITYCDPAGRAAEAQTGESQFEVFQRAGLNPVGQPSGIRDGCVKLFDLIADPDLPLLISKKCPWTLEAITTVTPDPHKPDLYDQAESSQYQHVLDALRYWAVNMRPAAPEDWEPMEAQPGPSQGMWGREW